MDDRLSVIATGVWEWLRSLFVPGRPGWVRFARVGAILEPGERAGLGISALAAKTAYMLNLLTRLLPEETVAWADHLRSFQASPEQGGYFEDPAVRRHIDGDADYLQAVRRAETRQACAALACFGYRPRWPMRFVPRTSAEAVRFLESLDWTQPWGAGSHAGHLLAIVRTNAEAFGEREVEAEVLPAVVGWLERLQDPASGCWMRGTPSPGQRINGAMKVISGLAFVGLPVPRAERLLDTALAAANNQDACHHVDWLYVVRECARWTDHRQGEIRRAARERIEEILSFRKPDGGFSFHRQASGTTYYGAPVSRGLPVSDVHGTALFVWALVLAADLLGWREGLGWRLPVT